MIVFCIVIFTAELLGLLFMIIDQKKNEKDCRERHTEPAVDMKERILLYLICVVFPTIIALLMRK